MLLSLLGASVDFGELLGASSFLGNLWELLGTSGRFVWRASSGIREFRKLLASRIQNTISASSIPSAISAIYISLLGRFAGIIYSSIYIYKTICICIIVYVVIYIYIYNYLYTSVDLSIESTA